MTHNPIARKDGLVLQEMPDELLVYDLETNKAHCLNETSAFVWHACDGNNSVSEITELFGNQSGERVPEELIWLAIDQLSSKNLLEKPMDLKSNGQTRREVIKKIGLATVIALPLISSLAAPTSVLAVGSCAGGCSTTTPCANSTACACTANGGIGGACQSASTADCSCTPV